MSIPRLTDFTAMMHDIAASAKIATCLLVISGFYLLSKRFELYSWGELPQWIDGIAVLIFLYSATSIVWEAAPRIWKLLVNAVMTRIREHRARKLDRFHKYVLLNLATEPDKWLLVNNIDPEPMETSKLTINSAAEQLVSKGLVRSTHNMSGFCIRLTSAGKERIKPIYVSFCEGNFDLWDD